MRKQQKNTWCVFLLLVDDDRFSLLKTEVDNFFLMVPRLSHVPHENKGPLQPHREQTGHPWYRHRTPSCTPQTGGPCTGGS
jgi:hypothetical protein